MLSNRSEIRRNFARACAWGSSKQHCSAMSAMPPKATDNRFRPTCRDGPQGDISHRDANVDLRASNQLKEVTEVQFGRQPLCASVSEPAF
jgi:hypothetical protein